MGSYLTIVNDTPDTWLCKVGPDSKALKWSLLVPFTALYTAIGGLADGAFSGGANKAVGAAAAKDVVAILKSKQYDVIQAGESKRYGKMPLSFWRQSECVNIHVNGSVAVLDIVMMRPIFSGATKGSTHQHRIGWWIQKHGTRQMFIKGKEQGDVAKKEQPKEGDDPWLGTLVTVRS